MKRGFKHLSKADRYHVKILLCKGCSLREIARVMGRSVSSISCEVKAGRRSDSSRYGMAGEYDPESADHKAYTRRKYAKYQSMKIISNPDLKEFVDKALLDLQSPETIAGRLKLGIDMDGDGKPLPSVSRSAIEKYLSSVRGEAIRFEIEKRKKLFRRRTRRKQCPKLDGRKFIDERPLVVQKRERLGDLEIDLVVSGRGGTGSLLSAVDRRSRISFVRKLLPVTAENLAEVLVEIKLDYEKCCGVVLKSITADNDVLFVCHKRLEELLGVPIYFCHPYSSWEKGSVENLNKYIRKFIRKGSNISSYSRKLIAEIENSANSRYMKVLEYLTPREFVSMDILG